MFHATFFLALTATLQAGYREGITAGKESALQGGFDQGFAEVGAPLGREIGLLRGFASALLAFLSSSSHANAPTTTQEDHDAFVHEARIIASELSNIRFTDIAPPDLEAEQHAREHLEADDPMDDDRDGMIVGDEGLQQKREMESLEDMMDRITAGAVPKSDRTGRPTMEDVKKLGARLEVLAGKVGVAIPQG